MPGPRTSLDDHMAAHYLAQYRAHGNGGICPIHGVARCREWVDAHTALVQEGVTPGGQPNGQVSD